MPPDSQTDGLARVTAALRHAQQWLALDSLDESAHRAVMEAYAWSNDRAGALRQFLPGPAT